MTHCLRLHAGLNYVTVMTSSSGQEEDGGRAGGRADVRVEEMSGRQGGVTGLTEELCGWGSLGSWG